MIRDKRRLLICSLFTFALFSLLLLRFYRVQIAEHRVWRERAQGQHEGIVTESFRRGTIYGNDQLRADEPLQRLPLALDVPKFHLHIDPASIPELSKPEMAAYLEEALDRPLWSEFQRQSRNRRLAHWLDQEQCTPIMSWWSGFSRREKIARNALFTVRDYQRCHPCGALLGQVLHTVRDDRDEATQQGFPTGGLEASLHERLSGRTGKRLVVRSPRRPLAAGGILEPAVDGADVILTISPALQAIAEEEVAIGVENAEAKSGWAILMEPRTGQILALAQYPPFDPSNYRATFNDPERIWEATVQGVSHVFEPGSTMKALSMALCLEADRELRLRGERPLFDPEARVATSNGSFPGRSRPIQDVRRHNYLNLDLAIQKSSNIYVGRIMERVIERLGKGWYFEHLRELGFGERVGIELPAESPGFLPEPADWDLCTPYSLDIGYNLLTTSVQMLRAWNSLQTGHLVRPTLVKRIVQGDEPLYSLEEQLLQEPPVRVFAPETVERMRRALYATCQTGGSGTRARVPGHITVGKTGTSEKVIDGGYAHDIHFSTFIGSTADLTILVAIDEPCYEMRFGGLCAAPVFRHIAERALPLLGSVPDDPDNRFWREESSRLREIYADWNTPGR